MATRQKPVSRFRAFEGLLFMCNLATARVTTSSNSSTTSSSREEHEESSEVRGHVDLERERAIVVDPYLAPQSDPFASPTMQWVLALGNKQLTMLAFALNKERAACSSPKHTKQYWCVCPIQT